ncbi:MAG: RNA-binding S4 domain-containing protein [Pseudomonadota bacterium]
MSDGEPRTQRLDQWFWHARFFKTRTLASKFVAEARVRVTRGRQTMRVEKPSFPVMIGDVVAFSRGDRLRIVAVEALASRRGPASEAQTLYTDQSPPPAPRERPAPTPFVREKGAGRPTKKDRRALAALKP